MTPHEAAARLAAAVVPLKVIPPRTLSPDEIRSLLRECVTVARPGELLFWRAPEHSTPGQLRELQQLITAWLDHNAPQVRVLALPGGEFAVVRNVFGPLSPIHPVPADPEFASEAGGG